MSRAGGFAVPVILEVSSSSHEPSSSGDYELVRGFVRNGYPVWKLSENDYWLFSGIDGQWLIGDTDEHTADFECNTGIIASVDNHEGRMPHLMGASAWQHFDGVQWTVDSRIRVHEKVLTDEERLAREQARTVRLAAELEELRAFTRAADGGPKGHGTWRGQKPAEAPAGGGLSPAASPRSTGIPAKKLKVQVPAMPRCSGEYELLEAQTVNGFPVWQMTGGDGAFWLYSGIWGVWLIGDEAEQRQGFKCDTGLASSLRAHRGIMPDRMRDGLESSEAAWQVFIESKWRPVTDLRITVAQPGDAKTSPSGSPTVGLSPTSPESEHVAGPPPGTVFDVDEEGAWLLARHMEVMERRMDRVEKTEMKALEARLKAEVAQMLSKLKDSVERQEKKIQQGLQIQDSRVQQVVRSCLAPWLDAQQELLQQRDDDIEELKAVVREMGEEHRKAITREKGDLTASVREAMDGRFHTLEGIIKRWGRDLSDLRDSMQSLEHRVDLETYSREDGDGDTRPRRGYDDEDDGAADKHSSHGESLPTPMTGAPDPKGVVIRRTFNAYDNKPADPPLEPGCLFDYISSGDVTSALQVLSRGDFNEINAKDDTGCAALHRAASKGLGSVCRAILRRPDFELANSRDWYQRTALHYAALTGSSESCRVLLEQPRFSDPDAGALHGRTALHCAAEYGHTEVCRTLLDCERFLVVDMADEFGHTALHHAAMNGHAGACQSLMDHHRFGAAAVRDNDGWTALHWASSGGHSVVVAVLLHHKRFTQTDAMTNRGWTALHYAASYGHSEVCRALLENPRFNAADRGDSVGRTALHVAAEAGHAEVCRYLLNSMEFTAQDAEDAQGSTAAMLAKSAARKAFKGIDRLKAEEDSDRDSV
eukprot:TRINITY_DN74385_c0_g1_i1.p1 TRINITY_DN74385_c0_g1~~TRINITY_DN74385_c0_g1_i1.p1  ORF type:complete len:877 (+),score=183.10 TRINITY_DN74385_c0_g1_i1:224-2854(+)